MYFGKHAIFIICTLLVFVFSTQTVYAQSETGYVENELLVRFTPKGEAALAEYARQTGDGASSTSFWQKFIKSLNSLNPFEKRDQLSPRAQELKTILDDVGVVQITPDPETVAGSDAPTIKLGTTSYPLNSVDYAYTLFTLSFENSSVENAVELFDDSELVVYAQPNYKYQYYAVSPNDPRYNPRPHELTGAPDAWEYTKGSRNIVVAVIDSGVDYTHEDLAANMWRGAGSVSENNDGPTGGGEGFHGTMVAGAVGAVGDNGIGTTGASWKVSIMGLAPSLESNSLSDGIRRAADQGADIINLSLGAESASFCDSIVDHALYDAIYYATRTKNVLVVAAAGNSGQKGSQQANAQCTLPNNHPDVLTVTALNNSGVPEGYSSYGPLSWKDTKIIASPLGNPTTYPNNQYISASGTSFSSPYVAGAAALLLSYQDMPALELRDLLLSTADDYKGADKTVQVHPFIPDDDGRVTYGKRLNLAKAMQVLAGEEIPSDETDTPPDVQDPTPTPTLAVPDETPEIPSTPTPTIPAGPVTNPELPGKTLQVDWVYDDQARCWNAWAENSCSLISHEGGASEQQRDLDGDGNADIVCSQGDGASQSTTLTNISGSEIQIACERYACSACESGNNSHAQCDNGIDPSAIRIRDTETVAPGCTVTCTLNGAYGDCLDQQTPPVGGSDPGVDIPENPTPTSSDDDSINTPQPDTTDQLIQQTIDTVTEESVEDIIRNLVDDDSTGEQDQEQTRYTGSEGFEVEFAYVTSLFENAGYSVTAQETVCTTAMAESLTDLEVKNLIARYDNPESDEKYLVTAHLDSRTESLFDSTSPAPGANDNASGVAAAIASARALSPIREQISADIEFVIFSGEEQGLCGSYHYVSELTDKENIRGVINLDMIGGLSPNNQQCVSFGYKDYNGGNILSDRIASINDEYNIGLAAQSSSTTIDASDHRPFWEANIPAIFGTECTINDHYHTSSDTVEHISFAQISKTAQAVAGALVSFAAVPGEEGNAPAPQTPEPTQAPVDSETSRADLPLMISYRNYTSSYSTNNTPTYIYGWLTDASIGNTVTSQQIAARVTQQTSELGSISGNVIKMMMTSSYDTTKILLENHEDDLKNAGVSIIGYNMERTVGTPENELNTMHEASQNNSVVRLVNLANEHGFDVVWGPIRANALLAGRGARAEAVSMMYDAGLRGVAFQEQKFIETQTPQARRDAVIADVQAYHNVTGDDFEIYVQVMSSRCGSSPWLNCMQFLDYVAPYVDGIAIWASGGPDVSNLSAFVSQIRSGGNIPPEPTSVPVPDSGNVSADEVQTLELINRERNSRGVSSLTIDPRVSGHSREYARFLLENNLCTHGSTEDYRDRINSYGISGNVAEIISCGAPAPEGAINEWLASTQGHREQMLSSSFTKAGVGSFIVGGQAFRAVVLFN